MSDHRSNVMIHVDESLDDTRLSEISRAVGEHDGVYSACFSDKARHLMTIDYDPERMKSSDVLHWVQSHGVHAELFGL